MNGKPAVPEEVRFYYNYLTTPRIFRPPICGKDQIKVLSWAPLLAFVYGEHAVLSGHRALLFKPNTFVAVALVLEKNVPDFMIRLRAYTRVEALNRFINEEMNDFEPVLEHEEADLIKFELIEKIIETYLQKNKARLRKHDRDELLGTAILHHISYFRPGSGINWSGSSAVAISQAIHAFYFEDWDEPDILRLAYPIELTYQEGRASGYGFSILADSSIMNYKLTKAGRDKIGSLKNFKAMLTKALRGDGGAQASFAKRALEEENVIFKENQDFRINTPDSELDTSIVKLLESQVVPYVIDTGIPKSTGKILLDLEKKKIPDTWHAQLAQVWESRDGKSINSIDKFVEFIKTIRFELTNWRKGEECIETNLWIPAYDKIANQLRSIRRLAVKFTGSGHGGSLVAFIDKNNSNTANHILKDISIRQNKRGKSQKNADENTRCKYFCNGLTAAKPGYVLNPSGDERSGRISILFIGVILFSLAAFGVLYLTISYHLDSVSGSRNEASPPNVNWLWPSAIALAVLFLPFVYKLYLIGCRATPAHMRSSFESLLLNKWRLTKAVGRILELAEKPGKGQLLVWLFLLFWSNLVFVSFIVLSFFSVFIGKRLIEILVTMFRG